MQNNQYKNKNNGFTLVELLVVVTLIGIIGTLTTQVFILGVKTQSKTEVLKEAKQSGDYALTTMESMIRNAFDVPNASNSCNTNLDKITILNQDGFTTTFDCSTSNQISSISGLYVAPAQPTPTGIVLTSNKVKISDCTFRIVCPDPPTSPKYVYMNFTISQNQDPIITPQPENESLLYYQSTVTLRNY